MPKTPAAAPGSAEAMEAFMANLADFPGGDLLAPHMFDGPFTVAMVTGAENDPNWLAASLLHAYPHRKIRNFDDPDNRDVRLYVFPARAQRLAEWYQDGETSYWITWESEPQESCPSDAELGEHVARAYYSDLYTEDLDQRLVDLCCHIAAHGYLEQLVEVLNARADDAGNPAIEDPVEYLDSDATVAHLEAFVAAMTTTTPATH